MHFVNIDWHFANIEMHFVNIDWHFANVKRHLAYMEKRFVDVDWHFVNFEIGKISGSGGNGYLTCRNEGRFVDDFHFDRLND